MSAKAVDRRPARAFAPCATGRHRVQEGDRTVEAAGRSKRRWMRETVCGVGPTSGTSTWRCPPAVSCRRMARMHTSVCRDWFRGAGGPPDRGGHAHDQADDRVVEVGPERAFPVVDRVAAHPPDERTGPRKARALQHKKILGVDAEGEAFEGGHVAASLFPGLPGGFPAPCHSESAHITNASSIAGSSDQSFQHRYGRLFDKGSARAAGVIGA